MSEELTLRDIAKIAADGAGLSEKSAEELAELSVQQRTVPLPTGGATAMWFVRQSDEGDIAPWWSSQRDAELRVFWRQTGNDILQGAVSSMIKKFKSMNWVVEGPERVAKRYQDVLANAEFEKGWGALLSPVIEDYLVTDKGAFIEVLGKGDASGAIEGPALGLAHMDSGRCTLTGDLEYPVLFSNVKTDKPHKIHHSRVIHLVDMPSPNEAMNGVGFSSVSRVVASSQVLLKLARYKNEKLSDLPEAGLLILNNIVPKQWEDAQAGHQKERRRLGHAIWSNVMALFSVDPSKPASANLVSFANLPDSFDERSATEVYINIVALAFGVDVREFWPMSAGPLGTAQETQIQHQKAKGKGIGDLITGIERAINWKVLPESATFRFDFTDDEEDLTKAQIDDQRTRTIMSMWKPDPTTGSPVTQAEIRQMLADNVDYFPEEFLETDVTDETQATDVDKKMVERYGKKVKVDQDGQRRQLGGRHPAPFKGSAYSGNWGHRGGGGPGKGGSTAGTGLSVLGLDEDSDLADRMLASIGARIERTETAGELSTAGQTRKDLVRLGQAKESREREYNEKIAATDAEWQAKHNEYHAATDYAAKDAAWEATFEINDRRMKLKEERDEIRGEFGYYEQHLILLPTRHQSNLDVSITLNLMRAQREMEGVKTGEAAFRAMVEKGNGAEKAPITFLASPFDRSGYAKGSPKNPDDPNSGIVMVAQGAGPRAIVHELGHHLEHHDKSVAEKSSAFFERRTKGEEAKWMGDHYAKDEVTKADKFPDPYCGKVYPQKAGGSEIVSMGLEMMFADPGKFAGEDPDYFDFIYNVTRAAPGRQAELPGLDQ